MMLFAANVMGQKGLLYKITPDLLEEISQSSKSDDMLEVIIIMNDQFNAQKLDWQMKSLNKAEQRALVVNELKQIAKNGQKEIIADLQQAEKTALASHVKPYWIINGISCSMTKDLIFAIAERPDVSFVMKNLETHIVDGENVENTYDDRSTNQWNVLKVQADKVWDLGYTGAGIIVAVIDSGVNYNHTDIANNMWNGGDDYPHHGWDFFNNDNDPLDDTGHGTHCAGTISSYGTNGKQCGIAKDAIIMALKVLGSNGQGSINLSWEAIEFAISHNADILSMSLGAVGFGGYWVERKIMENVLYCGVIASVAAGNTGNKYDENHQLLYPVPYNVGSPGNCPSPWHNPDQTLDGGHAAAVTVGATTDSDDASVFSSFGPVTWAIGQYIGQYSDYPWVEGDPDSIGLIKPDIAAPGSNIWSLNYSNNTGYISKNGTSMATPCVAGVMALMLQADQSLTPLEIDSIIEITATPCGGQTSKNNTFGAGRINALAAVEYILQTCEPPTNLTASVECANVNLSWTAADNVSSYRLYRNGQLIAQAIPNTSFTDTNVPAGNNTYYVKSNGSNNKVSTSSNYSTVNITVNKEASTPVLSSAILDSELNLSWQVPERSEVLRYTDKFTGFAGNDTIKFIAGQKYPSSMLRPYAGMQLNSISFYIQKADIECTIKVYEGDLATPGELIHQGSVVSTVAEEKITYTIPNPIVVNPNKDLWIVLSLTGKIAYDSDYTGDYSDFPILFQYTFEDNNTLWFWYWYTDGAWTIELGLSDGPYSYNIYQNGTVVSSQQSSTSFSIPLAEGIRSVQVTAITNGYESLFSNNVMAVKGQQSISNLNIPTNEKLIIAPNSTLTVSGALENDNPENLILEDGAQLINGSTGVKATVKKTIEGFQTDNNKGNWYLIASPISEQLNIADSTNLKATNATDYDLYAFNQASNLEWLNYKKDHFTTIDNKTGYLYAHRSDIDIEFAGTLNNTDGSVPITYTSDKPLAEYNLVGNPFPCNATIDKTDYYRIVETEEGSKIQLATTSTIAPMEGIFVKAVDGNDKTVTFSKETAKGNGDSGSMVNISVSRKTGNVLDNARIRLDGNLDMEKLILHDGGTRLYIPQSGIEYALVVNNDLADVPVNFNAATDGIYTLEVEASNDIEHLHLIDNLTGADINLLATPSYSFEAKTDDYPSRFRILFNTIDENPSILDNIEGDIQIMDVTGRVISTDRNAKLTPGVYILRTVNGNDIQTKKIIIK